MRYLSVFLWRGSRAQWDAKVAKVISQAESWKPGAAERAQVKMLMPELLDVLIPPIR